MVYKYKYYIRRRRQAASQLIIYMKNEWNCAFYRHKNHTGKVGLTVARFFRDWVSRDRGHYPSIYWFLYDKFVDFTYFDDETKSKRPAPICPEKSCTGTWVFSIILGIGIYIK